MLGGVGWRGTGLGQFTRPFPARLLDSFSSMSRRRGGSSSFDSQVYGLMTRHDGVVGNDALDVVVVASMVGWRSSKVALYRIKKSFRMYSIFARHLELHYIVGTALKPGATSAQATVYNGWLLGMRIP
jgi:hypothetical protein